MMFNKMIAAVMTALVFCVSAEAAGKSVESVLNTTSTRWECTGNRCPSGLFSHDQPIRAGLNHSQGLCGQTAVANVAANQCGRKDITPKLIEAFLSGRFGENASDGTRARHLLAALQKLECGGLIWSITRRVRHIEWEPDESSLAWLLAGYDWQASGSGNLAIVSLRYGDSGHWTTVTGISDRNGPRCKVTHLTWKREYHTPCEDFSGLMTGVAIYVSGRSGGGGGSSPDCVAARLDGLDDCGMLIHASFE